MMKNSTAGVLAVLVTVAAGVSAWVTKPDCLALTHDDRNTDYGITGHAVPGGTGLDTAQSDSAGGRQAALPRGGGR